MEICKLMAIDLHDSEQENFDINKSEDLVQIVAKDNEEHILIIATWNLARDVEFSMF